MGSPFHPLGDFRPRARPSTAAAFSQAVLFSYRIHGEKLREKGWGFQSAGIIEIVIVIVVRDS
jgi:hypothetical protein